MFKHWLQKLSNHQDTALLGGAFIALLLAMLHPTVPIKHNIYSYFLVADISQSMNAADMKLNGKTVTRLAYTQDLMHKTVSNLPCGTKVSMGLFAGNSIAALYTPIEVCNNFAAIQDTIDHLDWRTAWSGNSRVRESLHVAAKAIRALPEPAKLILFTDGEEAPKLHAFNTKSLEGFQGGDGWLFVGIGSEKGAAIPKLSEKNQVIGYWSNESFALQPGIAQISESTLGTRDDNVATGTHDRFISKLNPEYLRSVAKEIGGEYILGDDVHQILTAMKGVKAARRDVAPFDLHWVLAALAGLLLLGAYIQKHPLRQMLTNWRLFKQDMRSSTADRDAAIAHDNHMR